MNNLLKQNMAARNNRKLHKYHNKTIIRTLRYKIIWSLWTMYSSMQAHYLQEYYGHTKANP